MASRKSWDAHSDRWKREALRDGLTKKKWDAWLRLSATTRKATDPREYARGVSVRDQIRKKLEAAALSNMTMHYPHGRRTTMALGVQEMTLAELKWTATASRAQIKKKASGKTGETRNPWWYR